MALLQLLDPVHQRIHPGEHLGLGPLVVEVLEALESAAYLLQVFEQTLDLLACPVGLSGGDRLLEARAVVALDLLGEGAQVLPEEREAILRLLEGADVLICNVRIDVLRRYSLDYASVDTAFLLVDTSLYMQLVAYHDAHPDELPYSYATLYKHVRRAVDLCHCDGEIKDAVAAQLEKVQKAVK